MSREEWKQIPGYDGYMVSNTGEVLSTVKQVAISFAWVYAVILIAGLFLAFSVSIENGTRFLVDMTAIWSALFLLYTSVSLIFAIFASRRKEK